MGTEELCLHSEVPPDFTASLLFFIPTGDGRLLQRIFQKAE